LNRLESKARIKPALLSTAHAVESNAGCGLIRHLYVHIPFCPKVCPYCSFYKEASDRNKTRGFLDAVLLELDKLGASRVQPYTIFFGGGTPSALSTPQLSYLITGLRNRLDLSQLREWTLEMNPATVSEEKAGLLLSLGVNRISMGVQAWQSDLLVRLGRVHSAAQALRSYQILRHAGFIKVNLDLIFGIPGQTPAQWEESLLETINLNPEHISAYCLTYEEDTEYYRQLAAGKFSQNEVQDAALFEMTMDLLAGHGYSQYEISNYARPGEECLHNLAYWTGQDYLGLGPSAFSTVSGHRWQNVPNTSSYIDQIERKGSAHVFSEFLSCETQLTEKIVFGLRTNRGVAQELVEPWSDDITDLETAGYLQRQAGAIMLSRSGRMVADEIGELFV
jgi:oxygen-independent coproporphyrinogen-3 oxidase